MHRDQVCMCARGLRLRQHEVAVHQAAMLGLHKLYVACSKQPVNGKHLQQSAVSQSLPMLNVAVVQHVLVHCDLRPVEDTGLVHVVPDVQVLGAALVLVRGELGGPPSTHLRAGDIKVGGGA